MRPRILFFGTPSIAVPALRAAHEIGDVVAVVCQPDKPVGRDRTLHAPETKVAALELGIPVHQPTKVKVPEFAAWVREQRADVGLVIAYGRILVRPVLEAPAHGCLNLHASILPRYRGAAPIQWAVVRGETKTGITLMRMDEGVDTGPMLSVHDLAIGEDETSAELGSRLALLAAEVVRSDLLRAMRGELVATPQDDAQATLAPILTKESGRIDWSKPAREVHDLVRGMWPWPGAFTTAKGKSLKVARTAKRSEIAASAAEPGTVLQADRRGVVVACGEGAIEIIRAQVEGRKELSGAELAAGRALVAGDRLGEA